MALGLWISNPAIGGVESSSLSCPSSKARACAELVTAIVLVVWFPSSGRSDRGLDCVREIGKGVGRGYRPAYHLDERRDVGSWSVVVPMSLSLFSHGNPSRMCDARLWYAKSGLALDQFYSYK